MIKWFRKPSFKKEIVFVLAIKLVLLGFLWHFCFQEKMSSVQVERYLNQMIYPGSQPENPLNDITKDEVSPNDR